MKINEVFLIIGQILLGIQWLRMTLVLGALLQRGGQALVLNNLTNYYLVMIGFLVCSGFLYLNKQEAKE